ncbi:beta-lactamase class A [Streptomyces sp. TverLS-915]|uniref:class A beta-lactamase n=1 Tax=Streptomyces sp. TverLS-915 TaxID=1839763 RepID=UPI00081E1A1C|nr:class A beta-lactamase [Streptomyces sp. TverLS-915]SCD77013.1 beta-lactamase class A [Streptomyces sp. TverLS-915]
MRPARIRPALVAAALCLLPLTACGTDAGQEAPARPGPARQSSGSPAARTVDEAAEFTALERRYGAHLGVHAVDTGSGREVAWHADTRFSYNSTFKALLAGAVLKKHGLAGMDHVLRYDKKDLVANSPVTEKHAGTGLSREALCDAAIRYSDNTAANVLLADLGGPRALGALVRTATGDRVTRMERVEPLLSRWTPGETHDTTTPRQLTANLRAYTLGDVLAAPERERLTGWLRANTTGDATIRAGVPKGWTVEDKTGTGSYHGARDDIAVIRPPGRAPLVLTLLSYRDERTAEADDKLLAEATQVVVRALG